MYCVGLFFVVCVAVSDIRWLLWDQFAGESYFAPCEGLGANHRAFTMRFLVTATRSCIFGIPLAARPECAPAECGWPESVHKSEASSPIDNAMVPARGSNKYAQSRAARIPPSQPALPRPCLRPSRKVGLREHTKPRRHYGANGAER